MIINKILRDILMFTNRIENTFRYKDNGMFVFGEWMGKQATDSCLYLANYLCDNYPQIKIAWVCNKDADLHRLNKDILRLDISDKKTELIVKNASVLIMNQGLIDFSESDSFNVAKPLCVNIWHGVPWKKIGFDGLPKSGYFHSLEHKYQIKVKSADLYVSPSEEYKEKFSKAFFVKESKFINAGYPRNAIFYSSEELLRCRTNMLKRISNPNAKIIVYLPTFRDSHTPPFSFTDISILSFYDWLKVNNVYIIQKAHAVDTGMLSSSNSNIINVSDVSAQELMAASDMLITDYSSCFYDYLLLDRPIIHYISDFEYYKNKDRGLYYDKEDVVCGPSPQTEYDLIMAIKENIDNPSLYHELRMRRKEKFLFYDNPNNCEIIVQRIFEELSKKRKVVI